MSALSWYWHRLRAMSVPEMALHARKKLRAFSDARRPVDWSRVVIGRGEGFPKLPPASDAPLVLREALQRDVAEILSHRWSPFGHPCQLDDPPRWHKDYLAGVDLTTGESAFKLNHRALKNGADVRVIWELSRWHELVRLAMAAYVFGHQRAAEKCIEWLEHWAVFNAAFRGWNWTSALESGIRLVQLVWIDALLQGFIDTELARAEAETDHALSRAAELRTRLATVLQQLLGPHVWFTWRHKSFGSSANNHLMGELAGVLVAIARWPSLQQWSAPLETLQRLWEREVLAQFAEDGGNREQALNYHLFAFEFCLYAKLALEESGLAVSRAVLERLDAAMRFFWDVQADLEPWDYGDSDNAFVTPLFAGPRAAREWRRWMNKKDSPALDYWLDAPPVLGPLPNVGCPWRAKRMHDWWFYEESGIAVCESGFWWLRWDLSPLGYLNTAAHGHLDALHVSIWFKRVAFVIDPGTGAYFQNDALRSWLVSRAAHNAPCPAGEEWPRRAGPFLWAEHHARPRVAKSDDALVGVLELGGKPRAARRVAARRVDDGTPLAARAVLPARITRRITHADHGRRWVIADSCESFDGEPQPFSVRWQFAPGTWVQRLDDRKFRLNRDGVSIEVEVGNSWAEVVLVEEPPEPRTAMSADRAGAERPADSTVPHSFEGIVSRTFRRTEWAPYLKLVARPRPGEPGVFRTTFVAPASAP